MASIFGCVLTPFLLALHPCISLNDDNDIQKPVK